jgi:GxxExxY protein
MSVDPGWQHNHITKAILGCAFEVSNELGAGFLESVYERAMVIALRHAGMDVKCQHPVEVLFRGQRVGHFQVDLLVADSVLIELKAAKAIAPEHQAQIINYLNATKIEVGLLLNFGRPRLEYLRFNRSSRKAATGAAPADAHPVHPVHPCENI